MQVATATEADMPPWRALASEVELLFGPMVGQTGFEDALRHNMARGSAFCVRLHDGPPGVPLLGGLLWSARRGVINWLAVAAGARRQGIGSLLVRHVLDGCPRLTEVVVTTFAGDDPAGRTARAFYTRLGFRPGPLVSEDPPRRAFRLLLPAQQGGSDQGRSRGPLGVQDRIGGPVCAGPECPESSP